MKRIMIPLVAVIGFLVVWLGLSPDVEHNFEQVAASTADRILLTQAQAEKAPEGEDKKGEAAKESPKPEMKSEGAADHGAASEPEAQPAVKAVSAEPSCIPAQALADLNQRRKTLDEREAALQARDQELAAREKAIEERIKQLQAFRDEASKMGAAKKKESEEKIARTVELLESMNPKAASQLVASSDEHLAVEAISRMSAAKLSKIMNIMEPKRSVRLMELLAGKGTPVADVAKSVPETNPQKEEKL
jgi:flagellar motility protein MotE (MotC chaperone)